VQVVCRAFQGWQKGRSDGCRESREAAVVFCAADGDGVCPKSMMDYLLLSIWVLVHKESNAGET